MFTSLDQSVFPAHWCADYSKTHGFRAGGISKSLSHYPRGFAARLSAPPPKLYFACAYNTASYAGYHLHDLPLGGRLLRTVFLVDLLLIYKGTAAVLLLSGAEGVTKAVSTAAALVVEEEPKGLSPVLIVEVWVMWPVSVPRHV